MKVAIIDDDLLSIHRLEDSLLLLNGNIEVTFKETNPKRGLDLLKLMTVDVLFLDVQMPEMNGFQLIDQLSDYPFQLVFVTSFDAFAIKAIRYSALDYLLKPIDINELQATLQRAAKIQKNRVQHLQRNLKIPEQSMTLLLGSKQGDHAFAVEEIVRCEADSNYTKIILRHSPAYLASRTLSDIEAQLESAGFLRVHKSHLVNPNAIKEIHVSEELEMLNGDRVPISKRRLAEVKKAVRGL